MSLISGSAEKELSANLADSPGRIYFSLHLSALEKSASMDWRD
jgi:hypothetical protein